jgi:hypothetical protein
VDLVPEAEGTGLLLALVVVEQQARAMRVDAAPEIVGGVPDLGTQDGRCPRSVARVLPLESEHGLARVADGRFQIGHLASERGHFIFIRNYTL